jgi:hypothetical protein
MPCSQCLTKGRYHAFAHCAMSLLPDGPGVAFSDPAVWLHEDALLGNGTQETGPDEVVIYKPRWGAS